MDIFNENYIHGQKIVQRVCPMRIYLAIHIIVTLIYWGVK